MNPMHVLARHARRPVLMTPEGAEIITSRALAVDPNALQRPRSSLLARPAAWLRKAGLIEGKPVAYDSEEDGEAPAPVKPRAYAPLYAAPPEAEGYGWTLVEGIACIDVSGPLMDRGFSMCGAWFHGYDTLAMAVREASADARVKGLFMKFDSPGGVVAGGLPELAAQVRGMRASAGGKPVWAYCDMAASAAYWIAAQCDQVIAPAVGLVGSIGAVVVHEDWSEAYAQAGIKVTAVQFGAKKTNVADFKALSPEAFADIQAEIDECGRGFVRDVALGRPQLTEQAAIGTQAALYLAQHSEAGRSGLALKLCDQIMGEEQAFRALQAAATRPVLVTPSSDARAAAASDETKPAAQSSTKLESSMNTKPKAEDEAAGGGSSEETVQKIIDICNATDIDADQKLILIDGIIGEPAEEAAPAADPAAEPAPAAQSEADRAKAILALPEAKANPSLANALAFTAKSVDDAKAALKAAGGDRAAAKLGAIPDPKLGAGGEEAAAGPKSEDKKAADFIRAAAAPYSTRRR